MLDVNHTVRITLDENTSAAIPRKKVSRAKPPRRKVQLARAASQQFPNSSQLNPVCCSCCR